MARFRLDENRTGAFAVRTAGNGRYRPEHAELVRLLHAPLSIAMSNALKHLELERLKDMLGESNRFLQRRLRELAGSEIIGADYGLDAVMRMVGQVARMDSPVLLRGETGTGKGLIAAAIHKSSPRKDGPFIDVNCGAIPNTLLDSELFGHEKGAFTGAVKQKKGRFERAHGGTIFLDEIGELPPQAQIRILKVIQDGKIERVGGTEPVPVDIRIISATHRNLEEMVKNGDFREDLWYRLDVFPVTIPPLRHRKGDIPALVCHFIEKKSVELKKIDTPEPAPGAMERLKIYGWPGNVRELKNIVERALILHTGGPLHFANLLGQSGAIPETPSAEPSPETFFSLEEMTRTHIEQALVLSKGKISGAGGATEILKVKSGTLRRKMDKLGIAYRRKDVGR